MDLSDAMLVGLLAVTVPQGDIVRHLDLLAAGLSCLLGSFLSFVLQSHRLGPSLRVSPRVGDYNHSSPCFPGTHLSIE